MLGAAGLTAYGWHGGLAGAVIGTAVGLPCSERIGTWDFSYNRLTPGTKGSESQVSN